MAYRVPVARNVTLDTDGEIIAADVLPQSWKRITAVYTANFVRFVDELWQPYDMLYRVEGLDGEEPSHYIVSIGRFDSPHVVDAEVVLAFARDYAERELARGHHHAAAAMVDMLQALMQDHMYSPDVVGAFRSWFTQAAGRPFDDSVASHNTIFTEDQLCS